MGDLVLPCLSGPERHRNVADCVFDIILIALDLYRQDVVIATRSGMKAVSRVISVAVAAARSGPLLSSHSRVAQCT